MFGFDDAFGAVGGAIGSLFGSSESEADQQRAQQQMEDALKEYKGVNAPDLKTLLAQSQAGESATGSSLDPSGRDAQLAAIRYMQHTANQGGMTMADRVAQEQAQTRAAQYERGQRGAIEQSMAARGQAGGGAELAAKLAAAQSGAQNAYNAGSQAAAAAQARALQAMQAAGGMGSQLYGQDVSRAAQQDQMARFNASQRAGAYQTNFADQMTAAQGRAGAMKDLSQYYGGNAQRIRNQDTGFGGMVGTAFGGGLQAAIDNYAKLKGAFGGGGGADAGGGGGGGGGD